MGFASRFRMARFAEPASPAFDPSPCAAVPARHNGDGALARTDQQPAWRPILLLASLIALLGPAPLATAQGAQDTAPLIITYYGVSTLLLSAGEDQILVDGFFTRPDLRQTILGAVGPDQRLIERRLDDAKVTRLRAVLVAHAHHDHSLDAAAIARLTETPKGPRLKSDALVIGDASTARLVRANGVPEARSPILQDGSVFRLGPFTVTAYKVDHGPGWPPLRWLLTGDMRAGRKLPAWFGQLKDRENYSFLITHGERRILVHPSTGRRMPVGDRTPPLPQAELVFLGVGGLGRKGEAVYAREYWTSAQAETGARAFVPIHWDRFTDPLEAGLRDSPPPLDKPSRTFAILQANQAPGVVVCFLPPLSPLTIPSLGPAPAIAARGGEALSARPPCVIAPPVPSPS